MLGGAVVITVSPFYFHITQHALSKPAHRKPSHYNARLIIQYYLQNFVRKTTRFREDTTR